MLHMICPYSVFQIEIDLHRTAGRNVVAKTHKIYRPFTTVNNLTNIFKDTCIEFFLIDFTLTMLTQTIFITISFIQ